MQIHVKYLQGYCMRGCETQIQVDLAIFGQCQM